MLRRIASRTLREPVARATSPGPQPVSTSAAVLAHQYQLLQQQQQPQVFQQARGLSSSVLLSSTRHAYESKKVAELKSELKSRGLASSGRKDELVMRLVNSDSMINGSTANLTAPPQLRKKSTLASLRKESEPKKGNAHAGEKSNVAPPAATSQGGVKTNRGDPPTVSQSAKTSDKESEPAPIIDSETAKAVATAEKPLGSMKLSETPASLEAGRVHNAAADGLAADASAKASPGTVDEAGPAKKTTPPGLPPHKAPQAKETFNIQIPYYPEPPVPGPDIPVVTSYTSPHLKQAQSQAPTRAHDEPKAISVSASSAISHASDMSSHDTKSNSKEQTKGVVAGLVSDLQAQTSDKQIVHAAAAVASKGIDNAASSIANVKEQAKSAFASATKELADSADAKKGSSGSNSGSKSASSGSSSSPKKSTRPLNDHERTGVYVLLGIVTGGLVLGGVNKPSKNKKKKDEDKTKQQDADSGKKQRDVKVGAKTVTVQQVSPVAAVAQGDGAAGQSKASSSSVAAPTGSRVKAPIMCVPKGTQVTSNIGASAPTTGSVVSQAFNPATLAKLAQLTSCEVSDALLKLKVPHGGYLPGIELFSPAHLDGETRICGPAYTVKMVSQGNTSAPRPASHFVDAAVEYPHHVMVVQAPSNTRSAVWGGLMTARAQVVGLQGVILDGRCRDLAEHREAHFPVFARGHSTVGQSPFTRPSELQVPITISDPTTLRDGQSEKTNPEYPSLTVNPGDLVLADLDGVVVIPPSMVEDVIRLARKGRAEDANCLRDIKNGVPVKEAFANNRSK